MKPIPLFGTGMHGISEGMSSEDRLNCFYEVKKNDDRTQIIVRGTPGCRVWAALPSSSVLAVRAVGALLYVVTETQFLSVTSTGVVTVIAAITATTKAAMSDCYTHCLLYTSPSPRD